MDINSCRVRCRGGGGGGRGRRRRVKERKDMLKAGQSRGSIVRVNGAIIKQYDS